MSLGCSVINPNGKKEKNWLELIKIVFLSSLDLCLKPMKDWQLFEKKAKPGSWAELANIFVQKP